MKNRKILTEKVALGAIFTALVIILQMIGSAIRFGPFSISLVLVPIVLGAALCGELIGAWLGLVFGVMVLVSGQAAPFFAVSVLGTIATVLIKGIACGYCAGMTFNLLKNKNTFLAVAVSAVVCPVVNTGVFLLGCLVFFMDVLTKWANGGNVFVYMMVGLVGINFIVEMLVNVMLCPVIVRLLAVFSEKK